MEMKAKIWPRRLARQMARARLDKMGATGYNKEPVVMGRKMRSRFARSWQELAVQARAEAMAREAARRKKAAQQ